MKRSHSGPQTLSVSSHEPYLEFHFQSTLRKYDPGSSKKVLRNDRTSKTVHPKRSMLFSSKSQGTQETRLTVVQHLFNCLPEQQSQQNIPHTQRKCTGTDEPSIEPQPTSNEKEKLQAEEHRQPEQCLLTTNNTQEKLEFSAESRAQQPTLRSLAQSNSELECQALINKNAEPDVKKQTEAEELQEGDRLEQIEAIDDFGGRVRIHASISISKRSIDRIIRSEFTIEDSIKSFMQKRPYLCQKHENFTQLLQQYIQHQRSILDSPFFSTETPQH